MDGGSIPYTRVPKSSALLLDYLYHFERVAGFFNGSPFDLPSYKNLANRLQGFATPRRELAEILARQNQALGCGEATFTNLDRLSEPGTFAVVTGQQVGLISGPAYTLYKALTAIHLARFLSESSIPAVPVFWLATEDHDLEEVAGTAAFNEEYEIVPLRDPGERPTERSSVGYAKLSNAILGTLDQLAAVLPPGEARERLLQDLREAYRPGATWGQAFGRFMARLFGRWGVVFVDPLDGAIHALCGHVYEQAIARAEDLRAQLRTRSNELLRAGYHAQVHVAEDDTLIFIARHGSRMPLHQRDGQFFLDESESIPPAELKAWAADRPIDFSPNVLLRPLVQDMLLPTLAYVAGPSELAYLGQSQPLYAFFGRPMPLVFPRAGFTLVDGRTRRWMEKYRVEVEDVWRGEEYLSRRIAAAGFAGDWSQRFDQSEQELARLLERLREDIERLDPTLLDSLRHAQEKMTYQMERLRGKLTRAALQRSELLARHEQALLRFLIPRKNLQEREVSGVYFIGRAGYDLLDRLLDKVQTTSSDHQVVWY